MKLTKTLRTKVENELTEIRLEKNKENRANYEARRKACENEIDNFLAETVNPRLEAILEKYDMSKIARYCKTTPATHDILRYFETAICNIAEEEKFREEESNRYDQQKQLIEDFAIELELGADKSQFMSLLADLCDKMKTM